MISLKRAIQFHGHLGPYLILGLKMGEFALKKLKAKKFFSIFVKVKGASKKPKSCLIDGLQLSTGATFGKGNIQKFNGRKIEVVFHNLENKQGISLNLRKELIEKLNKAKDHNASERLAKRIYKTKSFRIFKLTQIN